MSEPWLILFVALWLLAVLLLFLVAGLSRRVQELEQRDTMGSSSEPVRPLPRAGLRADDLEPSVAASHAALVLFVSEGCGPCRELEDNLTMTYQRRGNLRETIGVPVVIVTDSASIFGSVGADRVVVDSGAIRESLQVLATPAAVLLDDQATVAAAEIVHRHSDLIAVARPLARPAGQMASS